MEYGKITPFTVHCATVSDEDAPPEANEKFLIVCDGLGGTGQTKHKIGDQYFTSAYIGSRCVSDAAKKYCEDRKGELWHEDIAMVTQKLKDYLALRLEECIQNYHLEKTLKGNMIELLPTTLAMAVFRKNGSFLDVRVIWAGDSRVYLLTPADGLSQLSVDDVDGTFDAMRALGQSNMNNNVTGEGIDRFHLNYAEYKIPIKDGLILFAASDGCFDYISSPMRFEYKLLTAVRGVFDDSPSTLGECIADNYQGENCKDDTTIAGIVIQWNEEKSIRELYRTRVFYMNENFRNPFRNVVGDQSIREEDLDQKKTDLNRRFNLIEAELIKATITFLRQPVWFDMQQELKSRILKMDCLANYFLARTQCKEELQKKQQEMQTEMLEKKKDKQSLNRLIECYIENYIQRLEIPQKKILFWDKKRSPVCDMVERYRELARSQKNEENVDEMTTRNMNQLYQKIQDQLEQSGELDRVRMQSNEIESMQHHDLNIARLREEIKSLQRGQDIEQYINGIRKRFCLECFYVFGMERILDQEKKQEFLKLQSDFKCIEDLQYEYEKKQNWENLFWQDHYKEKYEKYRLAKSLGKV